MQPRRDRGQEPYGYDGHQASDGFDQEDAYQPVKPVGYEARLAFEREARKPAGKAGTVRTPRERCAAVRRADIPPCAAGGCAHAGAGTGSLYRRTAARGRAAYGGIPSGTCRRGAAVCFRAGRAVPAYGRAARDASA